MKDLWYLQFLIFRLALHKIDKLCTCENEVALEYRKCDPLRQNPEQGSFVTFSSLNIKWTTSNYKLKWHQDHVCSINISQNMADFVSGIYVFLRNYTS